MNHFSLEQLLRSFAHQHGINLPPESLTCLHDADSRFRAWQWLAPVSRPATRRAIRWLCFLTAVIFLSQPLQGSQPRVFASDLIALIRYAVEYGLRASPRSEAEFEEQMDELINSILNHHENTLADRLTWLYSVDSFSAKISRYAMQATQTVFGWLI